MATRRPVSWFLTETGRKFCFGAITAIGIGVGTLKFTPETIFLYKYKEFVHYYKYVWFPIYIITFIQKYFDILGYV